MQSKYSVKLGKVAEDFDLEVVYAPEGWEDRAIITSDINRPALQLTGFFEYFDPRRIQIIGRVENTYLSGLNVEERRSSFEGLCSQPIPALVITRNMEVWPECLEMARLYQTPVLRFKGATSTFLSTIITYLNDSMCPRITRHGVLLEIYGEGVLLLGESGVGKSETAIELVKRGHRLIADDAVELKRLSDTRIVGCAPPLIRHYMELRGIGVIDVRQLFGMSAVKENQDLNLVINLEQWKDGAMYDRLGLDNLYTSILDVKIPSVTIPVKPGRNLAVIIEVAAMNNRHKKMGYNAAQEFTKQINDHFDRSLNNMGE